MRRRKEKETEGEKDMAKYKVACLEVYLPEILAQMRPEVPEDFEFRCVTSYDEKERMDLVSDADFILFAGSFPLSGKHMDAAPKVKLIQKWGIGVDTIDLKAAAERGIPVAITAGANATIVAEHTLLLMLAVYKRLPLVDRNLRQGNWMKSVSRTFSYQLRGKTVGIVGLGNIGKEVAKRVRAFECRAIYYDALRPTPEIEKQLGVEFRPLETLLAEADIVTLHTPLTSDTERMMDARRLSMMKPKAILINCARGEIVDEAALTQALKSGVIMGAGLDVFDEEPAKAGKPIYALDNVVLTPHTAGGVIDGVPMVIRHCFDNMRRVALGQPLREADLIRG
jgi:phosphoglycerate dehydrogenase-like enzyme